MFTRSMGIVVAMFAAFALAGCSMLIPAPPSSSSPSALPTATIAPETPPPTEKPDPTPPVQPIETQKPTALPTSCDELGSAATRATTVDSLAFFGDVEVPTIIVDAEVVLSCYWFAGDVTGVDLVIATVHEHDAIAVLDDAAAQGFTCGGQDGYTMCRLDEEADYFDNTYPVTSFYLYGSGVWLESVGSNLDTTALIDEIAASIWQ